MSNTLFEGNLQCVNKKREGKGRTLDRTKDEKKKEEETEKWSIQFLFKVVTQSNLNKKPHT